MGTEEQGYGESAFSKERGKRGTSDPLFKKTLTENFRSYGGHRWPSKSLGVKKPGAQMFGWGLCSRNANLRRTPIDVTQSNQLGRLSERCVRRSLKRRCQVAI